MEIQPSNVSHLLNGRNKPSLDFLIKLKEIFPEYSFDWIIMGRKPITINEPNPMISENSDIKFDDEEDKKVIEFDEINENVDEPVTEPKKIEADIPQVIDNKSIEKIILVYTDKTFDVLLKK